MSSRIILAISFLLYHSIVCAQVLKGRVIDQSSAKAIPFATIYFNGTTVGTTSDENGSFKLNPPENSSNPMIISAVGYETVALSNFSPNEELIIELVARIYHLKDIEVTGNANSNIRKRYLPVFRTEFLGKSLNPKLCKILNESDIMLQYDRTLHLLKALAIHPIQIQNDKLGYNITYFLDRFEYNMAKHSLVILGNSVFSPIIATDSRQQLKIEKNRSIAYLGSRMHFFRTLWDNSFDDSGYKFIDAQQNDLPPDNITIRNDPANGTVPQKQLIRLGPFGVYYQSLSRLTTMKILNGMISFDRYGYFNPLDIVLDGYLGNKRISDQLPYEYVPDPKLLKESKE